MNKGHGFIAPKIETREEGAEHLLGSIPQFAGAIINPDADWRPYYPIKEPQFKNGLETYACTVWATLNAIEALIYFHTKVRVNYADRYVALYAKHHGILDPSSGADPHKIAELIRLSTGLLREDKLPFSDVVSAEEFYSQPVNWTELVADASRWYDDWELSHEWVFNSGTPEDKRVKLKQALTHGPVCVSVQAWNQDPHGYFYKEPGTPDNHWTMLGHTKVDEPYRIYDSYDTFEKDLVPDYDFNFAKVYYLSPAREKLALYQRIVNLLAQIVGLQAVYVAELKKKPAPPPPPVHVSRIPDWARAIQKAEGWYPASATYRLNNPGALKLTSLTASFGGKQGIQAADGGWLCKFDSYDIGFNALCSFLTLAAEDKLKDYHDKRTLRSFTMTYATVPATHPYVIGIAESLKVAPDINITTLL